MTFLWCLLEYLIFNQQRNVGFLTWSVKMFYCLNSKWLITFSDLIAVRTNCDALKWAFVFSCLLRRKEQEQGRVSNSGWRASTFQKQEEKRHEAASAARLCIHLRPFSFHFWELMSKNQCGAQHKQTEDVWNKCHEPGREDCESHVRTWD